MEVSPGCTTGPYFPVDFSDGSEDLAHRNGLTAQGEHIFLTGRVLEKGGTPTRNMVIEIWQPDANGIFRHPLDPRTAQADPGFWNWGRARTNKDGWYRFHPIRPGSYEGRVPHINAQVLGIGLTRRLVTTIFFGMGADPVLDTVPAARRELLIPRLDLTLGAEGIGALRWDVVLNGENETPFFLD